MIMTKDGAGQNHVSVVLVADPSENPGVFLDFEPGIYKMVRPAKRKHEHEVLALRPVRINAITWR